ncbi:DUF6445 family protein [Novosphingobium sp. 9]|uniref:DUF6445 family protein n=1 Tax=Novosphingobium sp. 9 TaxID=2025349 RepID=UPI0028CB5F05|nr:DUF6445 family protein [Novosphingobium sp. 9]
MAIFDRATGQPGRLIEHAARSRFESAASLGSGYPGHFAPLPMDYIMSMVERLIPVISERFRTGPIRPGRVRGNFSLLTTSCSELNVLQRIPHVDSADPMQFAVVHYLCTSEHGGTGFFRHRSTGYEILTPERVPHYNAVLDSELAQDAISAAYVAADDALFALTTSCEAMMDRLIVYRSARLHGALAQAPSQDALDPRKGRLTANLFLHCIQRD